MVDDKTFDHVAQLSHFGWGIAVVLAGALWGFGLPAIIVWVSYAAAKEFIYDRWIEPPDIQGSNLKDFLFQFLGAAAGWCLLLLRQIS